MFRRHTFVGLVVAVVLSSCAVDVTIAAEPVAEPVASAVDAPLQATALPTPASVLEEPGQTLQPVLTATQPIPRGTSAAELVAAPTVYLALQALPVDQISEGAIHTVAHLQELDALGLVLATEVLVGEQLRRSQFRDPTDFTSAPSETPGAATLTLPPNRALDGLFRVGEAVRVIATTVAPDGAAISRVLFDAAEVLAVEANPAGSIEPSEYAISIALEPGEVEDLTAAMTASATLTIARPSFNANKYDVIIDLPPDEARELAAQLKRGDLVDVVSIPSNERDLVLVAGGVELLVDGFSFDGPAANYFLVSVTNVQLLAITATVENGPLTLVATTPDE